MKYVLMLAFLAVVWWLWATRQAAGRKSEMPREKVPERMVTCTHCGVHFPVSEGVAEGGRYYCSEAHRVAKGSVER